MSSPVSFPSHPPELLLRIHCSSDLLGGWISLKSDCGLLLSSLLNFILLEHIVKKRQINLIGLEVEEIRLERNYKFEKEGVMGEKEYEQEEYEALDENLSGQYTLLTHSHTLQKTTTRYNQQREFHWESIYIQFNRTHRQNNWCSSLILID